MIQCKQRLKRLVAIARCSTTLSKFEVVLSRIPKYLKVCTRSITSPSNTNFWHGSVELNTMTFVFFKFNVGPHSTQNCWNASNYCCSPTFDFDVRTRSSAKSNTIHACLLGPMHHILYRLSACLGHPNIAQTIRG